MTLTLLGSQIARAPQGYKGHLAQHTREQKRRDRRESNSSIGSILSGIAGVLGLFISVYGLWSSSQTSTELDALRTQVHRLAQAQARDSVRLATQLKPLQQTTPALVSQLHAKTPPIKHDSSSKSARRLIQ